MYLVATILESVGPVNYVDLTLNLQETHFLSQRGLEESTFGDEICFKSPFSRLGSLTGLREPEFDNTAKLQWKFNEVGKADFTGVY